MSTSTFASSMLLLSVLLVGICLAHPINNQETPGSYSGGPACTIGPLGMESGAIPDGSITASSSINSAYLPPQARLNEGNSHWWIPDRNAVADSWIQVDLGLPGPVVTGLIVQGFSTQNMETFSVKYSSTGESESWHDLENADGDIIQFNGNVAGGERVTVTFPEILRTRFLRIMTLTWTTSYPYFAFEVLGCRGLCVAHPISNQETQGSYSDEPACTIGPLGMESGSIPDGSITASSSLSASYLPPKARLSEGNNHWWIPTAKDVADSWIQVDLGLPGPVVTGLIVQSHPTLSIVTFSVKYSLTGESESWHDLENADGDTIEFNGNVDGGERVTITFPEILRTRFLRIMTLTWTSSCPGFTFEVLGCRDSIIRLAGGDDALRGRVEIYYDGAWGAVCDTNWDIQDATTVCRQLGFLEASEAKNGSFYGATELPIVMDRVACKGTEPYLSRCSFLCRENNPCTSTAGVICKPNDVRLVDGPARGSGRVEIIVDGTWGAICDNEWDLTDAGVVCRQLGYSGATHAEVGAFFGQGSGPNLMDGVICDGSEAKITDCPSHCWDKPKCNNTETAGVICVKGWPDIYYTEEGLQ
ncbi:uncharacterized protein [Asterias amurensis]|uniref:uncharacterized protein n=1 Tax=Asterias amurensis TaxID=7602 RepID=UPI003AB585B1